MGTSYIVQERQEQHVNIDHSHRLESVQIAVNYNKDFNGNAVINVDEIITSPSVTFDLKLDYEKLQDVFWIEQTEDKEQGVYSLVIRADEYYNHDSCISIDINICVPDVHTLSTLAISLANNGISIKESLIFEKLTVSVANGHIEFEGISSGITIFTVANGHVSDKINNLSNDSTSSVANGHTEISIKQIEQTSTDNIRVRVVVANGHIDLEVPSSFKGQFQLESFAGRCIVGSTFSRRIHRRSGRWGAILGYYGNDRNT
ncbi:hypothetical protein [Parasitella parasitica]|uniref:Adhesin domain-containing protein n=1 Tax=Parasitella parasitica TaxID=35722 RepID=A0A0B7N8I8_9FUNG|nr:hypothetical protein [Parasitella parasitica]